MKRCRGKNLKVLSGSVGPMDRGVPAGLDEVSGRSCDWESDTDGESGGLRGPGTVVSSDGAADQAAPLVRVCC